jgi:hypothetical protein
MIVEWHDGDLGRPLIPSKKSWRSSGIRGVLAGGAMVQDQADVDSLQKIIIFPNFAVKLVCLLHIEKIIDNKMT